MELDAATLASPDINLIFARGPISGSGQPQKHDVEGDADIPLQGGSVTSVSVSSTNESLKSVSLRASDVPSRGTGGASLYAAPYLAAPSPLLTLIAPGNLFSARPLLLALARCCRVYVRRRTFAHGLAHVAIACAHMD